MNKKGDGKVLMSKKAAELAVGTIVIIILALIVLVVLTMGFTMGWTQLWDKMIGFSGGEDNVQTIVQQCSIACTAGSQYDYCTKTQEVNQENKDAIDMTCKQVESITGSGLSCDSITC